MNSSTNASPASSRSRELLSLLEERCARRVKTDFEAWCRYALLPLRLAPARHHLLMIRELQDVIDGRTLRLMITMPPGSAKSTYGSKLFPAHWLARFPRAQLIGAAHTQTLADKFSYDIQGFVRDNERALGYGLATEAKDLWVTTLGGQYRASGVGSKITGFRADAAFLDDLVASKEAADSPAQREALWDWYTSELDSRLTPNAPRVLIMTRWHEDDVAGRLLHLQRDEWKVINIPALAEADDPLGRKVGQPLWDDDAYGYGALLAAKKAELIKLGKARDWWSLYQQKPRPPEGALFRPGMVRVVDSMPPHERGRKGDVRAWDLAATADGGDATVGVRLRDLGGALANRYGIVDVRRARLDPHGVAELMVRTAKEDGPGVTIRIPQDPGQAGKQQTAWLTGLLAGHRVVSFPVTGSKETRAAPAASQVNVGNFEALRADWNAAFFAELGAFPQGTEDDQVDAFSDGYAQISGTEGFTVTKEALARSRAGSLVRRTAAR